MQRNMPSQSSMSWIRYHNNLRSHVYLPLLTSAFLAMWFCLILFGKLFFSLTIFSRKAVTSSWCWDRRPPATQRVTQKLKRPQARVIDCVMSSPFISEPNKNQIKVSPAAVVINGFNRNALTNIFSFPALLFSESSIHQL